MADNGGQPSLGTANTFFTADALDARLSLIASTSASSSTTNPCVIPLPYALAPGTSLAVTTTTADGQSVTIPEDPLVGWSFTPPDNSAVAISGSACSNLKSGAYTQIAITYACGLTRDVRNAMRKRWTRIGAAGMMVRMGRWRGLAVGVCMLACAGCGGESLGDQHPTGSGGSLGTGGRGRGGTTGSGSGGTGPTDFCGEVDVPF